MTQTDRAIRVYGDWQALGQPILVGPLTAVRIRDKEVFSFEYEKEWL